MIKKSDLTFREQMRKQTNINKKTKLKEWTVDAIMVIIIIVVVREIRKQ